MRFASNIIMLSPNMLWNGRLKRNLLNSLLCSYSNTSGKYNCRQIKWKIITHKQIFVYTKDNHSDWHKHHPQLVCISAKKKLIEASAKELTSQIHLFSKESTNVPLWGQWLAKGRGLYKAPFGGSCVIIVPIVSFILSLQ